MTAVGRLIWTLGSARGMTVKEMCAGADVALARFGRLEPDTAVVAVRPTRPEGTDPDTQTQAARLGGVQVRDSHSAGNAMAG